MNNPKQNAVGELNFEMQDIDVFNIPDTKTRIATVRIISSHDLRF